MSERAVTAEALVRDAGENRDGRLRKVSLSFLRDTLSEQLGVGDCLLFRGTVRRPVNRGNPDEFDFATYLAVKGISGQVFLLPANWSPAETDGASDMLLPWTARMRVGALKWRGRMLARYRQSGLHGTEYALFAAVTLGEKSGLSHGMRSLYAETGVSHVLALSGMHLGLLMMLFNFVFVRCVRRKVLRTFVGIAALLLMWVYVFVAGLPASLVRAAFMYTMMWGAVMCGRKGFSVNALSACAFVMVCISPMYLYDTGFQLSFLAMAGILTVYPFWQNLKIMRLPVAGWLFRSLWLSFSAQLFTLPLVAYCFGLFSPFSAWLSLIVSPLTALLLFAMPLLLVASWGCTSAASLLAVGVGWIVRLQNGVLSRVAAMPFVSVEVDMPFLTMMLVYVCLVVWLSHRYFRHVTWLKTLLCLCLLLSVVSVVENRRREISPCLVFYNNPSCPAVHVIGSPRRSYLFPLNADGTDEKMAYIKETFWRKRLAMPPVTVVGDYRDRRVRASSGLVRLKDGVSFLMLHDGRWNGVKGNVRADVDYIYLCHGYRGDLQQMSVLFRPRCVVLDASLRPRERQRYMHACKSLGWTFYDMETQGALKVALK